MVTVYLGLGSNMGEKKTYLVQAIGMLQANKEITLVNTASFYRTEPYGFKEQDWFLNTAVEIQTDLSPIQLLKLVNHIEQTLGRERLVHWGPRTVDIDILTYGDEEINLPHLTIPHAEMAKRAFVMVPLLEIAPQFIFPNGVKGKDVLKKLQSELSQVAKIQ